MKINGYEITAFVISLIAFIKGLNFLLNKKTNIYNQLLVYASGSYLLEEFWVIVNELFGKNDSLFSVRLISIFGCFLFLLSYSIKTNKLIKNSNAKFYSLLIPIVISVCYYIVVLKAHAQNILIGITTVFPLIIASYFNFKYILSKNNNKYIKYISMLLILTNFVNITYFIPFISNNILISGLIDISMSLIILFINILNKRSVINE